MLYVDANFILGTNKCHQNTIVKVKSDCSFKILTLIKKIMYFLTRCFQ